MAEPVALYDRLLGLRDDLRERLGGADVLDAGLLATLADVETVLASFRGDLVDKPPQ